MSYELFLAFRYLNGLRRQQPVVSVIAGISMLGIALGVAALITVLGVMSGFDSDLEEKIIGANPHLLVQIEGGIADPEAVMERISEVPGVVACAPLLQTQVLLQHGGDGVGVLLRGIEPEREGQVTRLPQAVKEGDWPPGEGEIFIGSELARRWALAIGDTIEMAGGEKGKPRPVRLGGVFTTGMYEYDTHLALATLGTVQDLLKQGPLVSGIGVRLDQAMRAAQVKKEIQHKLGYPYWVMSWMDLNSNLFAALKLEKVTMFVILTLIVLVACFNIIATLLMLVVGKRKEIGILKSLGSSAGSMRTIFTWTGLVIGLLGTILGMAIGLTLCWVLAKYQFIQLPADIYYIDRLPVKLEWRDIGSVAMASVVISWAACLYPALVAARMQPAQALRYE